MRRSPSVHEYAAVPPLLNITIFTRSLPLFAAGSAGTPIAVHASSYAHTAERMHSRGYVSAWSGMPPYPTDTSYGSSAYGEKLSRADFSPMPRALSASTKCDLAMERLCNQTEAQLQDPNTDARIAELERNIDELINSKTGVDGAVDLNKVARALQRLTERVSEHRAAILADARLGGWSVRRLAQRLEISPTRVAQITGPARRDLNKGSIGINRGSNTD
jgi:hypothetical protein